MNTITTLTIKGKLCGLCPFVCHDTHGPVCTHSSSCARTGKDLENSTQDNNELEPVRAPDCMLIQDTVTIKFN